MDKKLIKKFFLPIFIISIEITFIYTFFNGIFWNSSTKYQDVSVFDSTHWFYINRGDPFPWNGVGLKDKDVEYPYIKAPFILINDSQVSEKQFYKIINLERLKFAASLPFLLSFLLIFFIAFYNEKLFKKYNLIALLLLFPICLFTYFIWFPRI